jgi:ELWxxDGT repeat protein
MKKTLLSLALLGSSLFSNAQSTITMVKDIYVGGNNYSDPSSFVEMDGKMYFLAYDGVHSNQTIWVTDGTEQGTSLVGPTSGIGGIFHITPYKNKLYFYCDDGVNGLELWSSDGTPTGTKLFKDINPGKGSSTPENMTVCNGLLFFNAFDGAGNRTKLWKTDGTDLGTEIVYDALAQPSNGSTKFTVYNDKIYFTGNVGSGYSLWESDGTTGGTKSIHKMSLGSTASYIVSNGTLFFAGADNNVSGLYKMNGSTIELVSDEPKFLSGVTEFTDYKGLVYFEATTTNEGSELWVSDGTKAGTKMVKDLNPGTGNSRPMGFNELNGNLYFVTDFQGDLWKTDGTTTEKIGEGVGQFSRKMKLFNNKLYFGGAYMWESDGTSLGTKQMDPIVTFENNYSTKEMYIFNDELYFGAFYYDDKQVNKGLELCKLGTAKTTSISKLASTQALVYPNPTSNTVQVKLANATYPLQVEVCDVTGKVMTTNTIQSSLDKIQVESLTKGIYWLKASDQEGKVSVFSFQKD